jgi:3-hydroxyisobutyrate dehydrogenase-like beta-hydroxyacid dehydrogenase
MDMQIGFIGLGSMGSAMARNLVKAGHEVLAWNRSPALTESVGLYRADFFELILGTLFAGRAYESYGAQITDRSFEPGFKAKLALKDMRLASELSKETGRTLPMLDIVRERLSSVVSAGLGEKDWSVIAASDRDLEHYA